MCQYVSPLKTGYFVYQDSCCYDADNVLVRPLYHLEGQMVSISWNLLAYIACNTLTIQLEILES